MTLFLETMAASTADAIGQALETTITFLEKNQKLGAKVYQSMEDNQILALVNMINAQSSVEAEQGMKWSERCLNSKLSDQNKAQLSQTISMAMCKAKHAKRAPQSLHAGFLNYLTIGDRRMLSDEGQHIFSRCSVAVRRCTSMGLILPCERTAGAYRPGKWLRGSSRELGGSRAAAAAAETGGLPLPGMQQLSMMVLQNMMMMNGGNTGTAGQGTLNNLILFPNNKRRRSEGQLAIANDTVAGQAAAATGGQGNQVPALQDIQETAIPEDVRKDDGSAQPFVPPEVPQNDTPEDHAKKMLEAFEQRKAANTAVMKKPGSAKAAAKPKAKAKGAAKAKAKGAPKAKAKGAPKAKAKGAPKAKSSPIPVKKGKPPMMAKGDPTCYYRCGKIHRSDTSECFRVFKNASDRCDLKVRWHNDMQNAWNKSLKIIDDHASQG